VALYHWFNCPPCHPPRSSEVFCAGKAASVLRWLLNLVGCFINGAKITSTLPTCSSPLTFPSSSFFDGSFTVRVSVEHPDMVLSCVAPDTHFFICPSPPCSQPSPLNLHPLFSQNACLIDTRYLRFPLLWSSVSLPLLRGQLSCRWMLTELFAAFPFFFPHPRVPCYDMP